MGVSHWRNLVRATMEVWACVGRKTVKTNVVIGVVAAAVVLLLLWIFVNDREFFFFSAEFSHATGISFLIYKLVKNRTCAGLSLKSQELTAIFLAFKICCSYTTLDIHAILSIATLIITLWVVYMIRVILKSNYMKDEDNFSMQSLVPLAFCIMLIFLIFFYTYFGTQ